MVLVDTSVWISHFRKSNSQLVELLENNEVSIHPFIIGELACGGLGNREEIITLLQTLPSYTPVSQKEYLHFVNSNKLPGKGIGFVDIHLLASCLIHSDFIWTLDKKLERIAGKFKIIF